MLKGEKCRNERKATASEALELIQIDHTLATHCMHQSLNPLSRALAQSLRTTIYGSLAFGALARPLHSFR
jgi:hypothetical protein